MKENELIAEFGGMVLGEDGTMYYDDAENLFPPTPTDKLKFHESWDWLMPVVDKIEADLEEEFRVVILEHECSIHQKTKDQKLQIAFQCVVERFGVSKIDATYKAVVEFIKQLNKEV